MTTTSFKIERHIIAVMLLTVLSIIFLLYSCNKENDDNYNSPAFHIAESEKLIIPAAIEVPANLPNGNTRVATYYAEGVQKYKAQPVAGTNPVTYQWVFVAPKADLYDASNKKVGTHGAGPYWQLFQTVPGSPNDSIFGQQFAPPKAASGGDGNIDWLQLIPKDSKTPTGIFANVSYIQRIATKGGKAPAIAPVNVNDTIDVKYTAIYRFTKKNQ
jgi:hypothetical protein